MRKEDFLLNILLILRETFEGSPAGQGSIYLDRGIGFFNTLEELSAVRASQTVGATTIAAHTEHAKFYLDRLCEFIKGRTEKIDWEQSWLIEEVDEREWEALRQAARKSYQNVLQTFSEVENWDGDKLGEAMSIVAHTAYHLGAIRQMTKAV